ncbi:MAG: ATP-binding protein [Thermodesulfobacteriota bacterium]|nr:ATP-binding protein [Thermodesulfobacteriota bacterium]
MINEIFDLQNPWRKHPDHVFPLKERKILPVLIGNLEKNRILGLIGSRQVGKSSILYLLIQHLIRNGTDAGSIFYFDLDDMKLRELFENLPDFIQFIGKPPHRIYAFIDEIQRLENPGLFLKELYDLGLNIKIIYSGSSQLEIKSKLKEHLVGRERQFVIHRLSFDEYLQFASPITKSRALAEMMLYGSYPAIALERDSLEKKLSIKDIFQSYVGKDITDFLNIGNTAAFNRLTGLLAHQCGQLLNIERLSTSLKLSRKETERYIDILEQTFIIKRIYPFFKNYKKEITKTPKVFFLDLGLRNFAIDNFRKMDMRDDTGHLFENFCLIEWLANDIHSRHKINFWRTTNQTEIDFIVATEQGVTAIEIKQEKTNEPKSFKTIRAYYPEMKTRVVTQKDFLDGAMTVP